MHPCQYCHAGRTLVVVVVDGVVVVSVVAVEVAVALVVAFPIRLDSRQSICKLRHR